MSESVATVHWLLLGWTRPTLLVLGLRLARVNRVRREYRGGCTDAHNRRHIRASPATFSAQLPPWIRTTRHAGTWTLPALFQHGQRPRSMMSATTVGLQQWVSWFWGQRGG